MHSSRAADWSGASELNAALEFLRLLWAIEHRLNSASKRMQRRLGVTGPQRLVLRIVEQFPGISAGDLARAMQLHPSTVTGIIDRLRRRRLLTCRRDSADQRRLRLMPGPAAPARVHSARDLTIEATVDRTLRRLPASQVKQARAVLVALAGGLEEEPVRRADGASRGGSATVRRRR